MKVSKLGLIVLLATFFVAAVGLLYHLRNDETRLQQSYAMGIGAGYRDGYVYGTLAESRKRDDLRDELFHYFGWYLTSLDKNGFDPDDFRKHLKWSISFFTPSATAYYDFVRTEALERLKALENETP